MFSVKPQIESENRYKKIVEEIRKVHELTEPYPPESITELETGLKSEHPEIQVHKEWIEKTSDYNMI